MGRILIVDDDARVRAMLVCALKAAGHQVYSAANGIDGTRFVGAIRPDLIISDLFMPEKEGLETITELHKRFPSVPILAISGGNFASESMLSVALRLGATNALEKPFDQDTLLVAIEKTLCMKPIGVQLDYDAETVGPILPESH
jgi:DNA-binding NtrC family response regulator